MPLRKHFRNVTGGLFMTLHGSRLFGVEQPDSDWDAKAVRLPPANDLLLGDRTALTPVETKFDDAEVTVHSLQHLLTMLEQADTNAIDVLYAARSQHGLLAATPLGERLLASLDISRLVTRDLTGALGYAKNQARKYSRKGDCLALLQALAALLDNRSTSTGDSLDVHDQESFQALKDHLANLGLSVEGELEYEERPGKSGGVQRFVKVAGKSLDLNAKSAYNHRVLESTANHYGERARQAQAADGRDLKAWYHALRVTNQALELHQTGTLTFPRPDAPLLREVRAGQHDNDQLRDLLDNRIAEVEQAAQASALPTQYDRQHARELVLNLYAAAA